MNMPLPMAQTTFDEINCEIHNAYVQTAQESMKKAADILHSISSTTEAECERVTQ